MKIMLHSCQVHQIVVVSDCYKCCLKIHNVVAAVLLTIALCPDLTSPANGGVDVAGFSTEDIATYTCNDGFELIGNDTATCTPAPDGNSAMFLPSSPECHCKS